MNSQEYKKFLKGSIDMDKETTNYIKTVGRQLTIFSSLEKRKDYIESKTKRIMQDLSIYSDIHWNTNPKGLVLFSAKTNRISLPLNNLQNDMEGFLYDIPYFLAIHYYQLTKPQSLMVFSFYDWLNYFTIKFFNKRLTGRKNIKIKKILSTKISNELKKNEIYNSLEQSTALFETNEYVRTFTCEANNEKYFYIFFNNKHHLYSIS